MAIKNGEFSDYEKQRIENIRKNEEVLASLNIQPLKLSTQLAEAPTSRQHPKKSRLSDRTPEHASPFTLRSKAKKGALNETSLVKELERAQQERLEAEQQEKERKVSLEMQSFQLEGINVVDASTANINRKKSKSKQSCLGLEYREEGPLIRGIPARIYSLVWHPNTNQDKFLLFSGDKSGNLGIIDLKLCRETGNQEGIQLLRPVKDSISNIKFAPFDSTKLYFSAYDGSIRIMDLHTQTIKVLWADTSDYVTSFDFSQTGNEIYFSTGSGCLGIVDTRMNQNTSDQAKANLFQLHEKKAQCVSTNWIEPNFFCTSSLDDTVCIWDGRKVFETGARSAYTPVKQFSQRRSVTSAYFHKNYSGKLVTTCYDDYLRFYDDILNPTVQQPKTIIRHNNQTGRWITTFKANWDNTQSGNPFFFIGDMEKSVSIFDGDSGSLIHRLQDEYLTAQPAVNALHPLANMMASGTASGKICIWS